MQADAKFWRIGTALLLILTVSACGGTADAGGQSGIRYAP